MQPPGNHGGCFTVCRRFSWWPEIGPGRIRFLLRRPYRPSRCVLSCRGQPQPLENGPPHLLFEQAPSKAMIMRCFVHANSLGVQPGTRHEGRIEIDCSNLGSELSGPENSPPGTTAPMPGRSNLGSPNWRHLGDWLILRKLRAPHCSSPATTPASPRRSDVHLGWAPARTDILHDAEFGHDRSPGRRLPMALTRPDPSGRSPTRQR